MISHPLLELDDVTVFRGDNKVLDNFSLILPEQESTVILGPNGAGKSTLLDLLYRRFYPVERETMVCKVLGRSRWDIWELRREIGFLSPGLQNEYPEHAVGLDVVKSGFYASHDVFEHQQYSPEQLEQVEHWMTQLGISSLRDKLYGELSFGQKRRLLLARALVHDPQYLILDEPTTGMDISAAFHYLALIRSLMQSGKIVLLVTHHLHEIPPEITHGVLISDGKVKGQGNKQEMLTSAHLSELFDYPLEVRHSAGFYQWMPA